MTAYHRSNLAGDLYAGGVTLQERLGGIAGNLIAHGYRPVTARALAPGLLSRTVQAQAMTMAYNNAFILLGLSFVVAMPAVLLLKRPKARAGAPADAH